MDNTDIIGGVSPLKQRQKTRGGKYAKKATATSKRRGGFQKAKGEWGGGGRNVGGYNVNTSFTAGPAWVQPANAGGTTNIAQKILGNDLIKEDPKGSERWEYRDTPAEPAKTGNDFADNCYEADGSKKYGHVYTSRKGKQILCKWGGQSTGAHDYDKDATEEINERRLIKTDAKGVETTGEYEVYDKNK
tara:strand:- start:39 stop:605 length:567 start_codon:yes stop_codon:yes gene_type:complete